MILFQNLQIHPISSYLLKLAFQISFQNFQTNLISPLQDYVRNITARAFAVVASSLGIPQLLLFLRAVCNSKKRWEGRHTGLKIVQQIAINMGSAILPNLKQLVRDRLF
jgi:hypothetical protein